jgi:hypothetical protein
MCWERYERRQTEELERETISERELHEVTAEDEEQVLEPEHVEERERELVRA